MSEVSKPMIGEKLKVVLNENISEIFSGIVESGEPLSSDSEYLQYLECFFVFSYEMRQVKNVAANEILKDVDVDKVVRNSSSVLNELRSLKKILKDSVNRRVEKCAMDVETSKNENIPLAPRLCRLSKELGLSQVEELAFGFVLISQAGSYFPFCEQMNVSSVGSMSNYCNMSPKELLDFLSPRRRHIENSLIEIDSQYMRTMSSFIMKMPKACVNALVGSVLTTDEFLKIDKTALARILQKEPTFKLLNNEASKKSEEEEEEEGRGGGEVRKMDEENKKLLSSLRESMKKKQKKKGKKKKNLKKSGEEGEDFNLTHFIDSLREEEEEEEEDEEDEGEEEEEEKESMKSPDKIVDSVEDFLSPYRNNIEYLDDRFRLIAIKIKIRQTENEKNDEKSYRTKERSSEAILRELRGKERMIVSKCQKRLEITKFQPRMEVLAKKRGLCEFEKFILIALVGAVISHEMQLATSSIYTRGVNNVGFLLWILCKNLEERVKHRAYFYKSSTLVSDGIITIQDLIRTDLMDLRVSIDRRMLDFVVGLDTEFSEIVQGSNLFNPNVKLEQVILPHEQKKLIVETVENFESFQKCRKRLGFDEVVSYGNSLVLLFYGESGTGKTMTANALAKHLGKKLLLVNFSSITCDNTGEVMKYIFRESKLNDALLFFDECEAFFEKRKDFRSSVVPLLTELEKHDGLIVMATNMPHELDEAMHRRITLSIEFLPPDPILREQIWKNHFPKDIKIDPNIDWTKLSLKFELTGGLIKNAVLSALSFAIARDGGDDPVINQNDLTRGAKHQMRGIFTLNEFDRRVIPKYGLSDIVVSESVANQISEVIQFEKARKVLFSQWGFGKYMDSHRSTSILLFGPPGSGKRKSAEAIAFEVGCPLKSTDLGEILSKYVYNTSKNIEKLFKETRKTGAVLMIEITSMTSNLMKNSLGQLLSNISNYRGIVIVVTNLKGMIDEEFTRAFRFVLEFEKPNAKMRLRIWEKLIPKEMPISKDVDLKKLSQSYDFSGANIENVLVRAASRAALESSCKEVSHKVLDKACREEIAKAKFRSSDMYQ